jgi:hypothetical protein
MRPDSAIMKAGREGVVPRPNISINQEVVMLKRGLTAVSGAAAVAALLLLMVSAAPAQGMKSQKGNMMGHGDMSKPMLSEYLVISPHKASDCQKVMKEVEALGPDVLSKYEWGCESGDHTAYILTQAASAEDALKMVPESIRGQARAIKVERMTPKEINMMHTGS